MNEDKQNKVLDSVGVLKEYYPEMMKAIEEGSHILGVRRGGVIDEINRCVKLYCLLNDLEIKKRPLEVLCYYLQWGYNSETKKDIIRGLGIESTNLNNINNQLRTGGFIYQTGYNRSANKVSEELQAMVDAIVFKKIPNLFIKVYDD